MHLAVRPRIAALLVLGALSLSGLAACGSGGDDTSTAAGTSAAAASTDAATTADTAAGTAATGKVSANDASRDEIAAAFTAAGIANADRWAGEVVEYRPYAADDPDLTHLRDELAKYDPAPDVLEAIIATLEP